VFGTERFRDPIPVSQIFRECDGQRYHLVFVGDASMHPGELFSDGPWYRAHGASDERKSALEWFHLLARHFPRSVWLNPDKPQYWGGTVDELRRAFPMFPLTLEGLGEAIASLTRGARR